MADAAQSDGEFMDKCLEINANAEKDWMASASKNIRSNAHDQMMEELEYRRKKLRDDLQQTIQHIQVAQYTEIMKLHHIKEDLFQKYSGDELDSKIYPIDTQIYRTDVDARLRIYALRKDYERETAGILSSTTLKSQNDRKKDDDARFMPTGKTNMYSRNYETLGEPTGNPLPLLAEPQRFRAKGAPTSQDK